MGDDKTELEEELGLDQYHRVFTRLTGQEIFAINGVFTISKYRKLSKEQITDIQFLIDEYDYGFKRGE